jgi:hypothetical protein
MKFISVLFFIRILIYCDEQDNDNISINIKSSDRYRINNRDLNYLKSNIQNKVYSKLTIVIEKIIRSSCQMDTTGKTPSICFK